MNKELQQKVDRAIKLIQSAGKVAKMHGQPLEICYSGGKDSDVILELARMSGVNYRAIYKNTTIDPPGTIAHAREMGCEVMQPKKTFRELMVKNGMPSRWRRFCCRVLKEYKVLDYAVVGIRRDESRARSKRYKEPEVCRVFNKKKGIKSRQYMPILDWDMVDVAEFLTERGVKCHPLYYDEKGMFHSERRLGCMCCPLQSEKKRIQSFKEHPHMAKYYINAIKEYIKRHPDGKMNKKFNGNAYDWFTSQVYCKSEKEFRKKFGATPLFKNDAIETKTFLQKEFKIEL